MASRGIPSDIVHFLVQRQVPPELQDRVLQARDAPEQLSRLARDPEGVRQWLKDLFFGSEAQPVSQSWGSLWTALEAYVVEQASSSSVFDDEIPLPTREEVEHALVSPFRPSYISSEGKVYVDPEVARLSRQVRALSADKQLELLESLGLEHPELLREAYRRGNSVGQDGAELDVQIQQLTLLVRETHRQVKQLQGLPYVYARRLENALAQHGDYTPRAFSRAMRITERGARAGQNLVEALNGFKSLERDEKTSDQIQELGKAWASFQVTRARLAEMRIDGSDNKAMRLMTDEYHRQHKRTANAARPPS